jgi:hypothetical protein
MESLLGQFYTRIKGSQEDIASEGLAYILRKSFQARQALGMMIQADCGFALPDLSYHTQTSGVDLERPDISGYDTDGNELVILEAKFWASLTDNQPLNYLKRLQDKSALVFICPGLRVRSVFEELIRRLNNSNDYLDLIIYQDAHKIELPGNRFITVKTWQGVLGTVRAALVENNETQLISDIDQVIGFCETIDNQAFLPMTDADLSPYTARRINSYYDLVDQVMDELKKIGLADTKGYSSAASKYVYVRYASMEKLGIGLSFRFDLWAKHADTPFWFYVKEIGENKLPWTLPTELRKKFKPASIQLGIPLAQTNKDDFHFGLLPLRQATEDRVIADLVKQILAIKEYLDLHP